MGLALLVVEKLLIKMVLMNSILFEYAFKLERFKLIY